MKRMLFFVAVLLSGIWFLTAEGYCGAGLSFPNLNTTIEWEENVVTGDFERIHKTGVGIDFQARLIGSNNKAFLVDTEIDWINFNGMDAFGGIGLVGAGKRYGDKEKQFILSGVLGIGLDFATNKDSRYKEEYTFFSMLAGVDGFISKHISKKAHFFLQTNLLIGFDFCSAEYETDSRYIKSYTITGIGDIVYITPKIGFIFS